MAVLFSTDLSWLSPLFIFVGVVMYMARQDTTTGRAGARVHRPGLILLALRLVVDTSQPLLASPVVRRCWQRQQRPGCRVAGGRGAGGHFVFQPGHRAR